MWLSNKECEKYVCALNALTARLALVGTSISQWQDDDETKQSL